MGCFVVSNGLCVRELLGVLAVKGEQGVFGGVTSTFWVVFVGGVVFWGVPSTFWVVFVDGVVFWGVLSMFGL